MTLSILYDIHRISYLNHTLVARALDNHEINGTEFALYSALMASGPVTISKLATAIAAPLPSTSKLVATAEKAGHVRRKPNPDDGRSTLVELTEEGKVVHKRVIPDFVQALQRVSDNLGGATVEVRWALSRLDEALSSALNEAGSQPAVPEAGAKSVRYGGTLLTQAQEKLVQQYIDFVRWQKERE